MSYYRHPPYRPPGGGVSIGLPAVTPVVKRIMITCGVVWGVQFLLFPKLDLAPLLGLVPSWVAHGAIWQLFTWMFLHSPREPFHILFNMLILWMVGGDLERHWGGQRFLIYYLVCGVGSGLFVTGAGFLTNPHLVTIGASGAIFGLILAFGLIFSERTILFMLIFPMRARTFAMIMFAIAFLYTWGRTADNVSHVAHLGGMVVGYLYLKRAWRLAGLYRDIRWRIRRRRFRVAPPRDEDSWLN